MLVISRREGEQLQIGDGITITIVRIDAHSVRIGIQADLNDVVMRSELLQQADADVGTAPPPTQRPNHPR